MPPEVSLLDGVLERVTFANPETGYTIAKIGAARGGGSDLVTGGRAAAGRAGGRVAAAARPVDEPPEVRPAVRGALLHHRAPGHHPGHPAVPGLGADQGHRAGDGRADGGPLRRRHHAHHRVRARPADRGRRPGSQAYRDDHRRLGRAEGHQGGDGIPAGGGGVHLARGADLQEVRRRGHLRGARRAVPAGRRGVGHRLQDGRHHRRRGRHRPRQPGADQGRAGLHPVRGGRRGTLLPARAQPDRRRGQDPRGAGRDDHPVPGRTGRGRGGGARGGACSGWDRIAGARRLPAALLDGRTVPGLRPPPPARRAGRPAGGVRRRWTGTRR